MPYCISIWVKYLKETQPTAVYRPRWRISLKKLKTLMKRLCVNVIFGVRLAFGSIHHTFHTSLNLWCFVQGRKNHKWKQTWLLSGALALRSQITAEKPETEIRVITSTGAILMKPWKVASFQGQWGEIRSGFSAFFPMDKPISIVNPAHTVCQRWAVEPMKEQAWLMLDASFGLSSASTCTSRPRELKPVGIFWHLFLAATVILHIYYVFSYFHTLHI